MSKLMQNSKGLILLVAILLLTNIAVLVYFLSYKKPGKPGQPRERKSIVEFVQKEIGFTDQQSAQFKVLHDSHIDSLKLLGEDIRKTKTAFYNLLQQPDISDSTILSVADLLGEKQEAVEMNNYRHFQKVRALCSDPQQQLKFDSMVTRMINRPFGRRGGPPRSDTGKSSEKR